jgi:hypothetical protein
MHRLFWRARRPAHGLRDRSLGTAIANGGGRGTDDGVHSFSRFGFGVTRSVDGAVHGHLNCLMAEASRLPGFTLMAVRGQATSGSIGAGAASFDGVGMLQTGNYGKFPATFEPPPPWRCEAAAMVAQLSQASESTSTSKPWRACGGYGAHRHTGPRPSMRTTRPRLLCTRRRWSKPSGTIWARDRARRLVQRVCSWVYRSWKTLPGSA